MDKVFNHFRDFGDFRLDSGRRLLFRGEEVVPLTPKAFETLLALVNHAGEVVEKEELIRQIWDGAAVEEVGLAKNISALRKALGESPGEHQYIATVPGRGYQFVAAVTAVIPPVAQPASESPPQVEPELPSQPARSWGRILAIAAGVAVLTVLAFFFYPFTRPALTDRDTVLLADFVNQTGDKVFDLTLREGLAAELEQSPFLNVFAGEQVRATLRQMRRDPDEPVTNDIAREICQRQGLKAFITGMIAPLGNHYAITLEATESRTGDTLARVQEEAMSKEQVLNALSHASSRLRARLGESLRSIQKFDALLQATTGSLEALQAYSIGEEERRSKSNRAEAIQSFQHAIALDPNFAAAYSALGVLYNNARQPGLAAEYATKAYELRDHASERDRLLIMSLYYGDAIGDVDKSIEVLELQQQKFPRDASAYSNLAVAFNTLGRFDDALPVSRKAVTFNPPSEARYAVLGNTLLRLNRLDEAEAAYREAAERHLDSPSFHQGLFRIAFLKGDQPGMQAQVKWADQRGLEDNELEWQAGAAAASGDWKHSWQLTQKSLAALHGSENSGVAAGYAAQAALRGAALDQCRDLKAMKAQSLKFERNQVSLPRWALAMAWCGESSSAESILADMEKQYPQNTVIKSIWAPTIRAALAIKRGNSDAAIDLLNPVRRYEAAGEFWPQSLRGEALLRLKKTAEAEAEFRKILDHRSLDPLSPLYARATFEIQKAAK